MFVCGVKNFYNSVFLLAGIDNFAVVYRLVLSSSLNIDTEKLNNCYKLQLANE